LLIRHTCVTLNIPPSHITNIYEPMKTYNVEEITIHTSFIQSFHSVDGNMTERVADIFPKFYHSNFIKCTYRN